MASRRESLSPASTANNDSSDEDDLLEELEQDKRRSERFRRKIVDTPPKPSSQGTSQNGTSVFGSAGKSANRQNDRQMATILRERKQREAVEKEIADLKAQQTETSKPNMSQEEKILYNLARQATRYEGEKLIKFDKYYAPIALFVSPVAPPPVVRRYWQPQQADLEPLHSAILNAHRNNYPLNLSFLCLLSRWCQHRGPPRQHIGRMLFSRVVYDPTPIHSTHSRRHELEALLIFVRNSCVKNDNLLRSAPAKLQPMIQVLQTFGAQPYFKVTAFDALETAPQDCLDRQVVETKELDDELRRLLRNLGRAFTVWTELVNVNADLCGVLGELREPSNGVTQKAAYCHDIGMLCVRVLLSPFGSRLGDKIGTLVNAIFNTIQEDEWDKFRRFFCRSIVEFTPRAGLLTDLVTYLMPFDSARARAVGLDVGFMVMWRWHYGPPESPRIAKIPDSWPVAEVAEISFTLEHVVKCLEEIPDLVPKTDMEWIQLLGRLLNFVILEHIVLETTQEGQLTRIQSATKRITKLSHRLPWGDARVSAQNLMNGLMRVLRAFTVTKDNGELALVCM